MNMKRKVKRLSRVFEKELLIVLEKEKKEAHFLNQDSYVDCLSRASEGIDIATNQVKNIFALNGAQHRQSHHGENRSAEIQFLKGEIKPEYKESERWTWWT